MANASRRVKPAWEPPPRDQYGEALVQAALTRHLRGYLDPTANGPYWDCTIYRPDSLRDGTGGLDGRYVRERWEIKCDWDTLRYPNMFFETGKPDTQEPSGLTITQADRWAHYVPERGVVALYAPDTMLDYLLARRDQGDPGYRFHPRCGDGNSSGITFPTARVLRLTFLECFQWHCTLPDSPTQEVA